MRKKSRRTLPVIGLVLFALLSFSPTSAHAESVPGWDFSVSGFVGAAIPMNPDVDVSNLPAFIVAPPVVFTGTGAGTFEDVKLNTSFSFGGSVGAWTSAFRSATGLDFGVEIDVTHFTPDADGQTVTASGSFTSGGTTVFGSIPFILPGFDINSTIIAGDLLIRVPIYLSASFPNGRVQWYLGGGVGADIADLDVSGVGSNGDTAVAVEARAGGRVFLTPHVALFAEYKFTHANHTWNFQGTNIEANLNVNHALFGITFAF